MVGSPGRSGGDRFLTETDPTKPDGGPIKPRLAKPISKIWDTLIPQLHQPSLRNVDIHELTMLCELLFLKENLSKALLLDPTDTKLSRQFMNVVDRVHKLSAVFGLNPSDRKRLKQDTVEIIDAADEWLKS